MAKSEHEVLTPTEAKGANNKKSNLRVLTWSLAILLIIGAGLLAVFVLGTPRGVEGVPGAAPAGTEPAAPTKQ